MTAFIIRRVLQMCGILALIVSLTFVLVRLAPGSPFAQERKLDPAVEQRLSQQYHLDGSLPRQLGAYWWQLLHGNLGESLKYRNRTVAEIIGSALPKSAAIGGLALALALTAGIVTGSLAAARHNTAVDRGLMLLALAGICLPTFLIAPLTALVFAIRLGWLPVAGWGGLAHLALPALCLAAPYAAYCARLMRSSMLDVLNQDFIRTARAKGLPERRVLYRHALKIGILPLISYAGPLAANVLTGSMVVETIFNIPGLGPFFVSSVLNRDIFLVGGTVIVYFIILVTLNTAVDVVYTLLDKRIKLW
ncbi:MAG: ABC transporter permease [Verrucomicrobiales bacterium]|jgi:ABC-type dipeptide/oligopeptide/nickel transport system permease component|nr:ABC transporter permease [Verrucomicrobiales bacterium]